MALSLTIRRMASSRIAPVKSTGDDQGIWKQILEDAARTAEFPKSHFLLLGRRDVGKSSIIRHLQEIGAANRKLDEMEVYGDSDGVAALDFAFLNVRNVEDEDLMEALAKTNVWILQEEAHRSLLMNSLKPQDLRKFLVLICLDLSEPWTLKEELKFWLEFATGVLEDLFKGLDVAEQDRLRDNLIHYMSSLRNMFANESADDFAKRTVAEGATTSSSNNDGFLPTINFGVPIVVCVCKSDSIVTLNSRKTQGQAAAALAYLRSICLPYGAALVYTCAKDPLSSRNIELLYQYVMHRLYDFSFKEAARLEPDDSVFVPSGWDDRKKIEEFVKKTIAQSLDKPYESVIYKPGDSGNITPAEEAIVEVEDMNSFLAGIVKREGTVMLKDSKKSRDPGAASIHYKEGRRTSRVASDGTPETTRGGTARRETTAMDPASAKGNSGSLKNFFTQLLIKGQRPATPRSPGEESIVEGTEEGTKRERTSRSSLPGEKDSSTHRRRTSRRPREDASSSTAESSKSPDGKHRSKPPPATEEDAAALAKEKKERRERRERERSEKHRYKTATSSSSPDHKASTSTASTKPPTPTGSVTSHQHHHSTTHTNVNAH